MNESTLTITVGGAVTNTIQGVVNGTQVAFVIPAGALPASTTSGGVALLTVDNIRVNASTGGTPQVTESGVLSYAVAGPPATTSNTAIAASAGGAGFILQSLGATSLLAFGTTNYTVCVGNPGTSTTPAGVSFTVQIKELVGAAFKTLGPAPAGEGGVVVPTGAAGNGVATTATQIAVTLGNIPTAATVYLPPAVAAPGGTTLSISGSTVIATGPYTGLVSFTPSAAGAVAATYTVTAVGSTGAQTFSVPVIVQFAANAAGAQSGAGAMNALVGYAPQAAITGPASAIPTFAVSTATPVGASSISLCQTTLLFPFVTNQLGFDTGLVLANTSTDALGFAGKSVAAPQSGTCSLNFYGSGAPAAAVPDPMGSAGVTSTTNTNGPVHAFLLSAVAPGFQGYVIAACPFLYAHGYAFLAYNLTQSNGAVEGYIAEVLAPGRASTVLSGISPTFTAGVLTALGSSTTTTTDPVQF